MKKQFFFIAALLTIVSVSAYAQKAVRYHVVVQLSSSDTSEWKSTINNLKNLQKAWGNNVEIEVVVHGPGIGFLQASKTTQHEAIKTLKTQGVVFMACENTLREKKIGKSEVVAEAEYVSMGIGEIVLKQEEGWSYIKAGF